MKPHTKIKLLIDCSCDLIKKFFRDILDGMQCIRRWPDGSYTQRQWDIDIRHSVWAFYDRSQKLVRKLYKEGDVLHNIYYKDGKEVATLSQSETCLFHEYYQDGKTIQKYINNKSRVRIKTIISDEGKWKEVSFKHHPNGQLAEVSFSRWHETMLKNNCIRVHRYTQDGKVISRVCDKGSLRESWNYDNEALVSYQRCTYQGASRTAYIEETFTPKSYTIKRVEGQKVLSSDSIYRDGSWNKTMNIFNDMGIMVQKIDYDGRFKTISGREACVVIPEKAQAPVITPCAQEKMKELFGYCPMVCPALPDKVQVPPRTCQGKISILPQHWQQKPAHVRD